MDVGFIGLGDMGSGMAACLARSDDNSVTVFDLDPERVEALVKVGASAADDLASLVAGVEVVVLCVVNDRQVLSLTEAMTPHLSAGKYLVVHSTVTPETIARCQALVGDGVCVLDVGISGGPHGARDGTLVLMAGGDAERIEALGPVFNAYGRTIHMGPQGAGMAAKLARNLIGYVAMAAAHEGMALAEASGVDLGKLREVVESTPVKLQFDVTIGRSTAVPVSRDADAATLEFVQRYANLAEKDLDDALSFADELGLDLPAARGARGSVAGAFGWYPTDAGGRSEGHG